MNFVSTFYKGMNFQYWNQRLDFELGQLINAQSKSDSSVIIGTYVTYIQLAEIVFHHLYILDEIKNGEQAFVDALFIHNAELREVINKRITKEFLLSFLEVYVFGIGGINNRKEKFQLNLQALMEAREDYLKNHDAINAFKHGFRISATAGASIMINGIKVIESDAQITYFARKEGVCYENKLGFSPVRTQIKSHVLLASLENAHRLLVSGGNEVSLDHYFIEDPDLWHKTSGGYSFRNPIT